MGWLSLWIVFDEAFVPLRTRTLSERNRLFNVPQFLSCFTSARARVLYVLSVLYSYFHCRLTREQSYVGYFVTKMFRFIVSSVYKSLKQALMCTDITYSVLVCAHISYMNSPLQPVSLVTCSLA